MKEATMTLLLTLFPLGLGLLLLGLGLLVIQPPRPYKP
jgi:hypothetical protein